MPISEIPTRELVEDLVDTLKDITVCEFALNQGVTTYGTHKSVLYRLNANYTIRNQIKAELERRGETVHA